MSFKTLIDKNSGDFIGIFADEDKGYRDFRTNEPFFKLPSNYTFDHIKNAYESIDFSDYELIEVDFILTNKVGADIRNKLTPFKNMSALLREIKNNAKSRDEIDSVLKHIFKQLDSVDNSINYLAKLF